MKKGFTLIELLVVIAIVGILSSVVISSLGSKKPEIKNDVPTTRHLAIQNNSKGCDGLKDNGAPDEAYEACREDCNQMAGIEARNSCIHGNNY